MRLLLYRKGGSGDERDSGGAKHETSPISPLSTYRAQPLHVLPTEREPPFCDKMLQEVPVGRLARGTTALVEVLRLEPLWVVVREARANEVAIRHLRQVGEQAVKATQILK